MPAMRGRLAAPTLVTALLTVLSLLSAGCAPDPVAPTPAMKVMALGDSITVGSNARGGYRINLWTRLVPIEAKRIDFVGSQNDGPAELEDADHEGHSGFRIDTIRGEVDGWLITYQHDAVLLLTGTNDVFQRYQLDTAPDRLRDLASRICTDRPGVHVAVGSIPPVPDQPAQVKAYNAAVPAVVDQVKATGCDVVFVDLHAGLTDADIFDRHPTRAGYHKMAATWYPAVESFYRSNQR